MEDEKLALPLSHVHIHIPSPLSPTELRVALLIGIQCLHYFC